MKWISVKDRLPDKGQIIAVYIPYNSICDAGCGERHSFFICKYKVIEHLESIETLCEEENNYFQCLNPDDDPILFYWMPLPEPPTK